jgi:hypothetical protein
MRKMATTGPNGGEEEVPKCSIFRVTDRLGTAWFRCDSNHSFRRDAKGIMRNRIRGRAFYRASLSSASTPLNAFQNQS